MNLGGFGISELCQALRKQPELDLKRDIQLVARSLPALQTSHWFPETGPILNGDDTAALRMGDEYILFAAEGMRPEFVEADPWFAGFCSVLVNVNDVAAMGGRPWAVTDVLFLGQSDNEAILAGMRYASQLLGVPIVGGHTTRVASGSALTAAVLGRARRLISSHHAVPGQRILVLYDLRGEFRNATRNFDAASRASAETLRSNLAVLPSLAEAEWVRAGKDISMAGVVGSLSMLCETSRVGAVLELSRIPAPGAIEPLRWLTAFPSFGFVLAAAPDCAAQVVEHCVRLGLACADVGVITERRELLLSDGTHTALYADMASEPLTGFGAESV
ncbi:MAG TPA: sll0787 family AIR synthase-like protein [Polyangiaceae bacterium]|nr:sll0787 family AIR synthase-like protein [Polyangiaceae bacterium]